MIRSAMVELNRAGMNVTSVVRDGKLIMWIMSDEGQIVETVADGETHYTMQPVGELEPV